MHVWEIKQNIDKQNDYLIIVWQKAGRPAFIRAAIYYACRCSIYIFLMAARIK